MKKLFALIVPVVILWSCSDSDYVSYEEQLAIDIKKIEKYLEENNLVATKRNTGLFYIIEEEGNDNHPTLTSVVKINYTGKLLNGEVFETGTANNQRLSSYIDGWKEGIPLFGVGGKGKLFIPSGLGYGSSKLGDIPKNSVLIFDVELVNIF